MAEHPNATLIRETLEAFDNGDLDRLNRVIADNVEWHEIGRKEARHGKAELQAAMNAGAADYTITGDLHDVIASDGHTIALVNATATRHGKTLNYQVAEVYHIKDGKIVERWALSDDTAAIAAFFA